MSHPALVFTGVSHSYIDGPPVIDNMNLTVTDGIYGVLGNNGVGKSTWLKLAAGMMPPSRGKVSICGIPSKDDAVREKTAILPESLALEGRLTGREFLEFAADIRGVPNGPAVVNGLLERFGIDDRADQLMQGLSFGSRRKVGLAAAFLSDAPVLLLDEPGNGLDVAGLQVVEAMIRERKEAGGCVVLSSHDMAFVARSCEKVLVMLGAGRVLESTPAALMDQTGQDDLHHAFSALVAEADAEVTP